MNGEKKIVMRPVSILATSAAIVILAVYLGILSRVTWEGFFWGWRLFGL